MRSLLVLALLAACGGDDAPTPPPKAATTGAQPGGRPVGKGGATAKKDDQDKLQARPHAEDRVPCPVDDGEAKGPDGQMFSFGTGPECKQEAPNCEPGLYCVETRSKASPTQKAYKCEPCRDRDAIRHDFKDKDFVAEEARDPFQSFVIVRADLGKQTDNKKQMSGLCSRAAALKAATYSYQDLKLVGLVSKGTLKTAVMMNSRNIGEFVHRGDCVGKEKALVSDIVLDGETACVHFQVAPDQPEKGPKAPKVVAREVPPVCLHPNGLTPPESQPPMPGDATIQVAPPPAGTQVAPPPK
jgi:hypothetical protein